MRTLNTIQKREKLNTIQVLDEPDKDGVNHVYQIDTPQEDVIITFQNGPRNAKGSICGVTDSDLLEIVRDRLKRFQEGYYATKENACALTHIEEALMWLNRKVEEDIECNILALVQAMNNS